MDISRIDQCSILTSRNSTHLSISMEPVIALQYKYTSTNGCLFTNEWNERTMVDNKFIFDLINTLNLSISTMFLREERSLWKTAAKGIQNFTPSQNPTILQEWSNHDSKDWQRARNPRLVQARGRSEWSSQGGKGKIWGFFFFFFVPGGHLI